MAAASVWRSLNDRMTASECVVWWLAPARGWPNADPSLPRFVLRPAAIAASAAASAVVYASGRVPRASLGSKQQQQQRRSSVDAAPDRKIRSWWREERVASLAPIPVLNYNGLRRYRTKNRGRTQERVGTYLSGEGELYEETWIISPGRKWRGSADCFARI